MSECLMVAPSNEQPSFSKRAPGSGNSSKVAIKPGTAESHDFNMVQLVDGFKHLEKRNYCRSVFNKTGSWFQPPGRISVKWDSHPKYG